MMNLKNEIYTDNHTHTSFSGDSDTPVRLQIEKAIELGLSAITITDHCDLDYPNEPDLFTFDFDVYEKTLKALKEEYKGKIDVLCGIEIGLRTDQYSRLNDISKKIPFDYIIGSIHVVDGIDPYYPEYWKNFTAKEGVLHYFEVMKECVEKFDCFDSLGHLDYLFRYIPKDKGTVSYEDVYPAVESVLISLIQKGKALELNTAGWKYGLAEPHPASIFLKRYKELGGKKITLGSDGHKTEHLAYDFDRVKDYLASCGFDQYVRYVNRKEVWMKL